MAYDNPRLTAYLNGILKGPPMAPADATARPNASESGVSDALRKALAKLAEWSEKPGREMAASLAERYPGTTMAQGAMPSYIGGPKGLAGGAAKVASRVGKPSDLLTGLRSEGPFDSAHALAMGKLRSLESPVSEMPDLLPAMARSGGSADDALAALKSRMAAGEAPRATSNPVDSWLYAEDLLEKRGTVGYSWSVAKQDVKRQVADLNHHIAVLEESPEFADAKMLGKLRNIRGEFERQLRLGF